MKLNLTKRQRIFWIVLFSSIAVALCAILLLEIGRGRVAKSLPDQLAAERWGEDSVQMSVFFAADRPYSVSAIQGVSRQIESALTDASLEAKGQGRLWFHAYSTERETYIETSRATFTVTATLIGGDYFYVHTPDLVSGAPLTDDAAGDGAVFLDETAAFALFGAVDVAGSTVQVDGISYTVAGVFRVPENRFYDGYGKTPRIYLTYSSAFGRNVSDVTVWEAVLPEPVEGFARGTVRKVFDGYKDSAVTVENSARFSIPALWEITLRRDTLGVRTSSITYPWFENVARVAEYKASSYLLWEIVFASVALVGVIVLIGALWHPTERALSRLKTAAGEKRDDLWEYMTIPAVRAAKKKGKTKPPRKAADKRSFYKKETL